MNDPDVKNFYESRISAVVDQKGVTRSTMMGFPCLRYDGDFFASCDHKTGDLIVKLTRARVEELVHDSLGECFSPAGSPFKEWVVIRKRDEALWSHLLNEALRQSQARKKQS